RERSASNPTPVTKIATSTSTSVAALRGFMLVASGGLISHPRRSSVTRKTIRIAINGGGTRRGINGMGGDEPGAAADCYNGLFIRVRGILSDISDPEEELGIRHRSGIDVSTRLTCLYDCRGHGAASIKTVRKRGRHEQDVYVVQCEVFPCRRSCTSRQ